MLTPIEQGRPIVDALRAVASSDAFLQRSFTSSAANTSTEMSP
jgi:hypothetical protein